MLETKVRNTADKLNHERMRAMRWASIAKQQRQFFKHTEGLGEPPQTLMKKKHPAGEIFCRSFSWREQGFLSWIFEGEGGIFSLVECARSFS